tara:strand:- start:5347 stop:6201 length:855 start_codon:yes stop_codon:yes gene_type:complete
MIAFDYLASPGELGNQMFKFAALKGIARNNGYDYLMPPSYLGLEKSPFLYKAFKKITKYKYQNHFLFKYFELSSVARRQIKFSNFKDLLSAESTLFDEKLFNNCPDNIQLQGYFQSPKYFENIENTIREDFKFKKKILTLGNRLMPKSTSPISLHIRRGDYITNPNHFSLDLNYYQNAIDYFGKDKQYFVFTDDPNWFKQQDLYHSENFKLISEITKNSTPLDLYIMKSCKKHIIANSTFSWWGAWLSNSKEVVFPLKWYKDEGDSSEDLPLKDWVGIKNNFQG